MNSIPGHARMPIRKLLAALALLIAAWLFFAPGARADNCPAIADKPNATPHVDYQGVEHLTYCYPATVSPGQNIIRVHGTDMFPQQPGYITRFDPELIYSDGTVPAVDVLHLHHAVWLVNGNPQFAVGEEKTIVQLPQGFGWRSQPTDTWLINDMLHDLVAKPAEVDIVWRMDFVPDTSPDAASIKPVRTQWMDVAGPKFYPVFNALRSMGTNGRYTFPDQATGDAKKDIGSAATYKPNHPITLIETAGHLHPGGLNTTLTDTRGGQTNTLFTSNAHYYEPAGAVSWDVAMGATEPDWMVQVNAGDKLAVHATYDVSSSDWYEVMGIMPIAVYDGVLPGSHDAMSSDVPQAEVLTHGHLAENNNHGDTKDIFASPLTLSGFPAKSSGVQISGFSYNGDPKAYGTRRPPVITPGQTITFQNNDAVPEINAFHTITGCKEPCNRDTGVAYPRANGPVSFDSGELGFNSASTSGIGFNIGAPAADRNTWTTPSDLKPGTYTYFCRIHPFMRGSFRVAPTTKCHGKTATQIGTDGPDVIHGTKGRDVIVALGGNDKIYGLGGNDQICGGAGNDKLIGGKGKDRLFGEGGKDRLIGGSGRDMLRGGPGRDKLRPGPGHNSARQ